MATEVKRLARDPSEKRKSITAVYKTEEKRLIRGGPTGPSSRTLWGLPGKRYGAHHQSKPGGNGGGKRCKVKCHIEEQEGE